VSLSKRRRRFRSARSHNARHSRSLPRITGTIARREAGEPEKIMSYIDVDSSDTRDSSQALTDSIGDKLAESARRVKDH
jgi:hypothetical protein